MNGIENLFQTLFEASKATQTVNELVGRMLGLRWAIVSTVATEQEPERLKLAMIKVLMPHQGGNSESDWIMRLVPWQGLSVPMPKPGDTVLVGFSDGDPHSYGFYLGIPNNLLNPAYKDGTVWRYDFSDHIFIELSKESIKFVAFACSITLDKERVDITAPMLTFNNNPQTKMVLSGDNINFDCPGKVQAKSKEVGVLGAKDTRNDILVESGQ
jgi:phage baseplate assembly protein gpV